MVRPHQTLVLTLAAPVDRRASSQFSGTRVWPRSSRSAVLSLRYGLSPCPRLLAGWRALKESGKIPVTESSRRS